MVYKPYHDLLLPSFTALVVVWSYPGHSRLIQGPRVNVEQTNPARVEQHNGFEDVAPDGVTESRRRIGVEVLAPIPVPVSGTFVVKINAAQETRTVVGHNSLDSAGGDLNQPSAFGVGAVFLPPASVESPQLFLVAARYGHLRFHKDVKPMSEYVLGADFDERSLPFQLSFSSSDNTMSRVLVRYRRFPGFNKWLLLVGHKIERENGWFFDAQIPNWILVGWSTFDLNWSYYGGIRWTSREYPFSGSIGSGWMDGYSSARFLGVRRKMVEPLFLSLEIGMESQTMRWVDEQGAELNKYRTRWAPWGKLALQTWIKKS